MKYLVLFLVQVVVTFNIIRITETIINWQGSFYNIILFVALLAFQVWFFIEIIKKYIELLKERRND